MNHEIGARRRRRLAQASRLLVSNTIAIAFGFAAYSATPASAANLNAAAAQPQQDTTFAVRAIKSRLGLVAQSDAALLGRTDATPVNVVVKLDYDSVAS